VCSILDIDLDYFNDIEDPVQQLSNLLTWAGRPVDFIVEEHQVVLKHWQEYLKKRKLPSPMHILHVDEHHDMMDEKSVPNIANVMVHALHRWNQCRVHWLVENPIDSPEMWLSDSKWGQLSPRFSMGPNKPAGWPKPDIVSVCISNAFIPKTLREQLLTTIENDIMLKAVKPVVIDSAGDSGT